MRSPVTELGVQKCVFSLVRRDHLVWGQLPKLRLEDNLMMSETYVFFRELLSAGYRSYGR
jgi:hypothetical protein